jgi:hypothetical protein
LDLHGVNCMYKNWDRFLLAEQLKEENEVFKHNRRFLASEWAVTGYFDEHSLFVNLHKVTPLYESKIVKYLGGGVYGRAFLLENDHVFKLFSFWENNDNEDSKDWKIYKRMYKSQTDGSTSSLVVYDLGMVYPGVAFVETNRVYTLMEYFQMTDRPVADVTGVMGVALLQGAIRSMFYNGRDRDSNKKLMGASPFALAKRLFDNKEKFEYLEAQIDSLTDSQWTEAEVKSLMGTLIEFIQKHSNQKYDIHGQNIGVATYTPGGNNVKFVIFDF